MSRGRPVVIVVVTGVGLLLGMHSGRRHEQIGRDPPAAPVGPTVRVDASLSHPAAAEPGVRPAGRTVARAVQADPERVDPALAREHRRLLDERPVLQHLPYRDRKIGVNVDRVTSDGRLELLVTYLGSRARAEADFRRLVGRYGDPGTAYVERYQRVF